MTNLKDVEQAAYTAPVMVSDEMVRIALDEYYPVFIPSDTAFEDMRRALTAVVPHLTAALSSAPSPDAAWNEALEVNFMQRVWANLYFDEHDAGYTFQQTLNDVVEWLSTRSALPDVGAFKSSTIRALQNTQPEPAVKVDEWQPIETAPRDGTLVDLWSNHGTRTANVRWVAENRDGARHPSLILDGWKTSSEDPYTILTESQFTHWMPLPAAPLNRIGGAE